MGQQVTALVLLRLHGLEPASIGRAKRKATDRLLRQSLSEYMTKKKEKEGEEGEEGEGGEEGEEEGEEGRQGTSQESEDREQGCGEGRKGGSWRSKASGPPGPSIPEVRGRAGAETLSPKP